MIHIVTDTVAGLSTEMVSAYGIHVVPQAVIFGETIFLDMIDLAPAQFYAKLSSAAEMPHTSAPSIGDFALVYQDILARDPQATILSIHPSSDISGTVHAVAEAIATLPGADIRLFDTRSASLGLGLMVLEAARMQREGQSAASIMSRMEEMRDRTRAYFLVDTLDYLAKGGRIGRASHLLGTLLDIKPMLRLNDGVVEDCGRYRTHRRAFDALADFVIHDAQGKPGLHLGVVHAAAEAEAQQLADRLCASLRPDVFLIGELGPAIGAHVGPGTLGVCYYVPDQPAGSG